MLVPSKSLLVRRTRLPSRTTRDDFRKTKLSAWFPKPRSTRPKMTQTETVSNLRTVLKTTATLLRDPSAVRKLPRRWTQLTRVLWKARSKRLSAGSTTIPPPRRKNTKRSKRNSKALPCRSFKRWEVQQEDQEVCPTWEACLEPSFSCRDQLNHS